MSAKWNGMDVVKSDRQLTRFTKDSYDVQCPLWRDAQAARREGAEPRFAVAERSWLDEILSRANTAGASMQGAFV